jgi:hypothetical protein
MPKYDANYWKMMLRRHPGITPINIPYTLCHQESWYSDGDSDPDSDYTDQVIDRDTA